MNLAIAILSALLAIRDGVMPQEWREVFLLKYVPHLPWYYWALICATSLLVFIFFVVPSLHHKAILAQKAVYRKRLRDNEVRRGVRHLVEESVKESKVKAEEKEVQPPQEAEPKPAPRPAFKVTVPVTSKPGLVRMDVNLLRMAMPDEAGVLFPILVEFENLPSGQGKSVEVNDVWAHITYRDFDFMNTELARVGSGCWIDQPIADVSFPLRTPRYLMLGGWRVDKAEPMENVFRIFEYSRDLHRAVEKDVTIAGPKVPFVMTNGQLGIAQRRLVIDVVLTSNGHHDDGCEYQFQVAIFGGDGTGHSITCVKKP